MVGLDMPRIFCMKTLPITAKLKQVLRLAVHVEPYVEYERVALKPEIGDPGSGPQNTLDTPEVPQRTRSSPPRYAPSSPRASARPSRTRAVDTRIDASGL